jgi:hypothetical protein
MARLPEQLAHQGVVLVALDGGDLALERAMTAVVAKDGLAHHQLISILIIKVGCLWIHCGLRSLKGREYFIQ